jgi:hypothetical protein
MIPSGQECGAGGARTSHTRVRQHWRGTARLSATASCSPCPTLDETTCKFAAKVLTIARDLQVESTPPGPGRSSLYGIQHGTVAV